MPPDLTALLQTWDPALKILGAIAAPGGLWFWIDKYRNRIRIKVRSAGFTKGDASGRNLTLKLENVGSTATSVEPSLTVVGLTPKRKTFRLAARIQADHVKLPPLELIELSAFHADKESRTIFWAWYFVVSIHLTRGRTVKVRCRNASFEQLGFWRFHTERLRFKLLRWEPSAA